MTSLLAPGFFQCRRSSYSAYVKPKLALHRQDRSCVGTGNTLTRSVKYVVAKLEIKLYKNANPFIQLI